MLQHATYLLLDAARMAGLITEAQTRNPAHESLYRGTRDESLAAVAPYLFRFTADQSFAHWYLKQGWGHSWGVLLKSGCSPDDLSRHFRHFLIIKTDTGQSLYFRFFDPRVLRVFLPTCDVSQLREFFGPVDYFLVEDEDPSFVLRFWHENGILRTQRLGVADIIAAAPEVPPLPDPTAAEIAETIAAVNLKIEAQAGARTTAPETFPQSKPPMPQPAPAPATVEQTPQPAFMPDRAAPQPPPGAQKKKWNLFD